MKKSLNKDTSCYCTASDDDRRVADGALNDGLLDCCLFVDYFSRLIDFLYLGVSPPSILV